MSLEILRDRLEYYGGANQQDRMIRDKLKSLLHAMKYSYQAALFSKYPEHSPQFTGVFNRIIQNENFDTKMISTPFTNNHKVGDIFQWHNTDTFWITFLQDRTELAYFRGQCRRCDHVVKWVTKDREVLETLVSVIGPSVPTLRTSSSMQAKIAEDFPNANLKVLTTDNEQNRRYFNRYQKFLLKGIMYQIEEVDNLSMPGVIQMSAIENYSNLIEDDVEQNITNTWNILPIVPTHPTSYGIEGETFIKPQMRVVYKAIVKGGHWLIIENEGRPLKDHIPAKFEEYDHTQQTITVYWDSMKSGQFTLGFVTSSGTLYQKAIFVESLM